MTILDFHSAIEKYRKLRESGISLENGVKQLFESQIGRLELIKAVEMVEKVSASDSQKLVTRALSGDK